MKKNYNNVYFKVLEENYPYFYAIIEQYELFGMEELLDEVMVCFDSNYFTPEISENIIENMKSLVPEIKIIKEEIIEEKNWNEEIEQNTPIIIVSDKIGIAPEWKINELHTDIKIIINPKMSFGTGQHSTTKLVCSIMESVVQKGQFWIDAGTGTGLLAILAHKLGAERTFAFDNDEWSVDNAKENFSNNQIFENFSVEQIDMLKYELPESDGIVANMFVNILDKTADKFYNSLKSSKGDLILSGILTYDCDYITNIYLNKGFQLIKKSEEFEWVALHFKVI